MRKFKHGDQVKVTFTGTICCEPVGGMYRVELGEGLVAWRAESALEPASEPPDSLINLAMKAFSAAVLTDAHKKAIENAVVTAAESKISSVEMKPYESVSEAMVVRNWASSQGLNVTYDHDKKSLRFWGWMEEGE